jgi:hypothetical protein
LEISDFNCGKAGEHIVVAKLILMGYEAFIAGEGLPYDVVVDINSSLKKIQVKTTRKPRIINGDELYVFGLKKGKNNRKEYLDSDIDFFAFVALDTMEVAFLKKEKSKSIIQIRKTSKKGEYKSDLNKNIRDSVYELRDTGKTFKEIGKILGKLPENMAQVYRDRDKENIKSSIGNYFEDIQDIQSL